MLSDLYALLDAYGLPGLFLSAFLSSTLLPGGSEALLAALALHGGHDASLLLTVATLGNALGGMTSWGIGWWLARSFPDQTLEGHHHRAAAERLRHWGSPLLLLSWLPLVGDPLCVAAGWLRIGWLPSLTFITLGKGARYALLLAAL